MNKKLRMFSVLLFVAVLFGCKETNKKSYLPESIGAINNLTVVIENDLWKGDVGDKIREHFAAPVVGLTWDEPLFNITNVPASVFSGALRNTRAVLYVQKDTLNIAHIKRDMYARPQKIGVIKGHNNQEIIANIDKKATEIIAAFKKQEIDEAQKRFLRSLNKEKALENQFNISLNIPSIYKVGREVDNFVWIDHQIPKGTVNVIAYTVPANSFKTDSTLVRDIVHMRDSIGEKYIPGPDVEGKITHMRTEPAFSPNIFPAEINGMKAIEVRGIWDIKNYPMAGPFITYIIDDTKNNRKLVIEGFTFAPATEKRDYMFQLEAILKTLKINVKEGEK
ncbi:uncharacterized protein DUF4837 [Maribacter vaceletii]|uniref:Uncharacterized protein DUF4837 n=1 Tax=Maribacter vaceletii TaxID=1206816 RepID=A0A495ED35_9FLAO|nr:DUF4837 family protein [Maribacter vaceletii]RKR14792.1 uncharacterized protein DUF4837 [Maribacter vaceletii]